MLQVLRDFYADLYKNNDVQIHGEVLSFLESLDIPLMSTKIVEGEISSDEVMMVINKLKPGKAPGSDGLTAASINNLLESYLLFCLGFLMLHPK